MPTDQRARLAGIRRFDQLVAYLRDEMGWPIDSDDFEELTFEYTPEELGIDPKNAAKIQEIKRLRPLVPSQPWGIFFVKFEPRRLPVVALRRILGQVALKKRASANKSERQAWAADDLLFVSNYGDGDERRIAFAHFSKPPDGHDLPTLKVLGWDNRDTLLHLDAVANELTTHLAWPSDVEGADSWRERWRAAFKLRHREVITTSRQLSERLAELARAIRDRIGAALDIETETGQLTRLMRAFQTALVHDLDEAGFADMYAQTIAYGLLSARITDPTRRTADEFAAHMRTNPFLKELMETFLQAGGRRGKAGGPGIDFDELGVSEVVELLDRANMEAVVRDFGDRNPQEDPVIHFYEHFLAAYDKKQKVSRGVFYTPRPVVSYIVRSVDELLRTKFDLEDGLADVTTWGEMTKRHEDLRIPDGTTPDQVFVQILDPATGTGTFLVEIIDLIRKTMVGKWRAEGHGEKKIDALWNQYVPRHLLPRLHGYELLMAPYAIAHLKIGLKLYETGYRFESDERARVYLTNALEPPGDGQLTLDFLPALAHEAAAVNEIKCKQQFTVVVGNPPYAQYSSNLQDYAKAHIAKFRCTGGERIRARNALQLERNLNDDYVKFLGFAADRMPFGPGVLGMITNRMFLESESLVGLREWFATHFERSVLVDLRGSSEEARRVQRLAGDENVFDILQGVAVSFHVGRRAGAGAASIAQSREVIGDRSMKYEILLEDLDFSEDGWREFLPEPPNWWLDREVVQPATGERVLLLDEVFMKFSTLVASNRDHLVVDFERDQVSGSVAEVRDFKGTDEELCKRFSITAKRGWNIGAARKRLAQLDSLDAQVCEIDYRPFDRRWIFFDSSLVWQTAPICSRNVLGKKNLVLVSLGKNRAETTNGQWIVPGLADKSVVTTRDNASGFPLYLYHDLQDLPFGGDGQAVRRPNLRREFLSQLCIATGLPPATPYGLPMGISPEDVLHYIYALLQAPSYRAHCAADLVNGFPPVVLPPSIELFGELSRLGAALAALHMLRSPKLNDSVASYAGPRNPEVGRVGWLDGTVWIDAGKNKGARGPARDQARHHRLPGRARGGLGLPHRWLPGLPQVAQGPEGPHALGRGHCPLPEDRRRPERDHPHHGRDRRGHRSPRRLAGSLPDRFDARCGSARSLQGR